MELTSNERSCDDNDKRSESPLFIGVFLSVGNIKAMQEQQPRFRHDILAKTNIREDTQLYFFTFRDVDLINNCIFGTYYDQNDDAWKQKNFPLPDVLYDRGGGFLPKQIIVSDYLREVLEEIAHYKKINPVYHYDKFDFYQQLVKQQQMNGFLPKTKELKAPSDLTEMFESSVTLYVKDSVGSNGRGVMRLEKKDDSFFYSFFDSFEKTLHQGTTNTVGDLYETIQSFIPEKTLIVQEAINVLTVEDSIVDMRATMQRNKDGQLEIMGYPVRLGASKNPITSTQSGAKPIPFDTFFMETMGYDEAELKLLKERVEAFLYIIYTSVENAYGTHGEMGIDFAIDKGNTLWLIECNAKPGHDTLYKAHQDDTDLIERIFRNPIDYAHYLYNNN